MPAPIFLQDTSGLAQGISTAGSAFAQALQARGLENRQRTGLDNFQTNMNASDGDPTSIEQAYKQALSSGANPQHLSMLAGAYKDSRKQNSFKYALDAANEAGGMETKEGKTAFLSGYEKYGGDPVKGLGFFKPDRKGQTVFDKKIDEFKAQAVIDHMHGENMSQKTFNNNLEFLEENIDEVGRMKAITGGKLGAIGGGEYGPFQTSAFAEYERRGNLVLDGVIKVFNKAGVLPEKKLKWIRDTFAISPFDTREQTKGRIAALRSLSKDVSSFQDQMGSLIEKYGDNIPNSVFLKLKDSTNKALDRVEDKFGYLSEGNEDSPSGNEKVYAKLPTSGRKVGDIATDVDTGKEFIWNGSRWTTK